MNKLYYGDNLDIMQQMPLHCVDLIYLDPPFNSKKTYNLMYKTMTGRPVSEQVDAFCDTWEMDPQKEKIARNMPVLMREQGIDDYAISSFRTKKMLTWLPARPCFDAWITMNQSN